MLGFCVRLIVGAGRAVLISGGAYWRITLLPVFTPAVRDRPVVAEVLNYLGLGEAPDWYFYAFAMLGAIVILAFRVSWVEIQSIKIKSLDVKDIDGRKHLVIGLKNESFKPSNGLKVSILSSDPNLSFVESQTQLPIVLATQQQLQRQRSGIEKIPQRRFNLSPWETKWIELFYADAANAAMGIVEHQNGNFAIRLFPEYLLNIEVNGPFQNLTCQVYIISDLKEGGEWKAFLIRDKVDMKVLRDLGLRGWW